MLGGAQARGGSGPGRGVLRHAPPHPIPHRHPPRPDTDGVCLAVSLPSASIPLPYADTTARDAGGDTISHSGDPHPDADDDALAATTATAPTADPTAAGAYQPAAPAHGHSGAAAHRHPGTPHADAGKRDTRTMT